MKRMIHVAISMLLICSLVLTMVPSVEVNAVSQSTVTQKLNTLINQYANKTATSNQMYQGSQCKGFANWVFLQLFGVYIGPYPDSANYKITNPQAQIIGIIEPGGLTQESAKNLLMKAKPGDYIQVQRSIAKSGGKCGPHSMIVVEVKSDGVVVFDCNSDDKNTIKTYLYSWAKFDYDNRAMSLYHANGYTIDSSQSVGYNPTGCLDNIEGGDGRIGVCGWAFDKDSLGTYLDIHVFVGGPAGSGAPGYVIKADKPRSDVETVHPGVGLNHGFNSTINVSRFGSQEVYVYAINVGSGSDTFLGSRIVTIGNSGRYTVPGTNANLAYAIEPDGISVADCNEDAAGSVKIPEYIDGIKVNRIAREAFTNCRQLENVIVPNGAYRIGSLCFENCSNLKSVVIPKSVIGLGTTVFAGCTNLTDIYYEGSQEEWKNIIIDEGTLGKADVAIHYNYGGEYKIPGTNANIAFAVETNGISVADCNEDAAGSITIPENINGIKVNRIAREAFTNCRQLENVFIPGSAYRIGSLCFENCSNLKSVVIPKSVVGLGTTVFAGCTNLTDIYYEGSQEEWKNIIIDEGALGKADVTIHYNCGGEYKIPGTNANIAFAVEPNGISVADCNEDAAGSITIPENINGIKVNRIAREAFTNCSELVNVTISGKPYRIGGLCFEECKNLESVTIPKSVVEIGTTIFKGCDKLTDIYYEGSPDDWKNIIVDQEDLGKTDIVVHYNGDRHKHNYSCKVTSPTCIEKGYTTYTCTLCGDSYVSDEVSAIGHKEVVDEAVLATCISDGWTEGSHCEICNKVMQAQEKIPASGHKFSEWEIISASNCTGQESRKRVCLICKYMEMDGVDVTGHDWAADFTIDKSPTCVEEGTKSIHCRNCDAVKDSSVISALGHKFDEWKTVKAATCEQIGEQQHSCQNCGKTDSRIIEKTGHNWNVGAVTSEPQCEAAGVKTYTCMLCEEAYEEEIPAVGHRFSSWQITKAPTCSEEGEQSRTCSECGQSVTRTMETLAHQYKRSIMLPMCLESGYTLYTCVNCGHSYEDNYTEATGHKFAEWETVREATCVQPGEQSRICSECGEKETILVDMVEHQYKRAIILPDCTNNGYVLYTCVNCGHSYEDNYTEATGHAYSEWEIVEEPTCEKNGRKEHICTICGDKEIEIIPAIGNSQTPDKPDENVKLKRGTIVQDAKTGVTYKVITAKTVEYVKPADKGAASIIIPDTLVLNEISYQITSIAENAFKNNKRLTRITIGKNVVSIGKGAFSGCGKLKTVTFSSGSGLTKIGAFAFYKNTSLTRITIPKNVKKIGQQAFGRCKKLKKITIKTTKLTNKTVGNKAFSGIHKKAQVKVPAKKWKAYKNLLKKKGLKGKQQSIIK